MDKELMRSMLPEIPPAGLIKWVSSNLGDELGGEFVITTSELVSVDPSMEEEMDNISEKRVWAAYCKSTCCGYEWYTRKVPDVKAIEMASGEDGNIYSLQVDGADRESWFMIDTIFEGNKMYCPHCGSQCRLIHSSSLRGGRTKRIQVMSAHNLAGYTVLIYWIVSQKIYEHGKGKPEATPRDAFALTEKGSVVRYSHTSGGGFCQEKYTNGWRIVSNSVETWDKVYNDWGSICNRKRGSAIYPELPDFDKTTGEKTGLYTYLRYQGEQPINYLKLWKRYKNIENLVNAGHLKMVGEMVAEKAAHLYPGGKEPWLDLKKAKPHEILRITKEEHRQIVKCGITLDYHKLERWDQYRNLGGQMPIHQFLIWNKDNERSTGLMLEMMKVYGEDIPKYMSYLEKQGLRGPDIILLRDSRRMAKQLSNRAFLTHEEMWPRNLHRTHDGLAEQIAAIESKKKADNYKIGFQQKLEQYGALEWTDGELCIRLPRGAEDLIREGQVLRHCVGTYCESHAMRDSMIFFVRRYRRPERSYYTLNINMAGKEPREVQLHGYGNEHHGPNKEYTHSIPKKVRDFCDRWEREILYPFYLESIKAKEKTA